MDEFKPCGKPDCWVFVQVYHYLSNKAVLGVKKHAPLNLEIVCPHRQLCAACTEQFPMRLPDRTCGSCLIVPEIPEPSRCNP